MLPLLPLAALAQAPTVVRSGLTPAANTHTAARTTTVAVPFSQAIDPATASGIRIHSARYRGQRTVAAAVSGNMVTLTPTASAGASATFRPGETLCVTVPAMVQGPGGTAAAPYVYQFTTAASGGTGDFGGGADVVVGQYPYGVALGDLDGDGDLDLVTANYSSNTLVNGTVSVRFNDGLGRFAVPVTSAELIMQRAPYGVALGDVDGDGDLDVLCTNYSSNTVSVRLNDGSGQFTSPATNAETAVGRFARGLALGDLDGDGDIDFVVTNSIDQTVSVRLNNGMGGFAAPASPDPTIGGEPFAIVLGDVDGDGDLDFVATNNRHPGTVSVRLNNGGGVFTAPATNAEVAVGTYAGGAALGDLDGDGDLDLLTTAGTNRGEVNVRLNNGSGVFTAPAANANPSITSFPYGIALGDVDGDGDLDFVTANNYNKVNVRLNDGAGSFAAPATNAEPAVGLRAFTIALGDLDGDGDLDFVTANANSNTVSVRLNNGTALATARTALATQASIYPTPTTAAFTLTLPPVAGATQATATLLNALGQAVSTRMLTLTAGGTTASYTTTGLSAGVYALRLQAGAETATLRVVVE